MRPMPQGIDPQVFNVLNEDSKKIDFQKLGAWVNKSEIYERLSNYH